VIGLDAEFAEPTCSRAGCRSAAAWNVNWRNPRLHGPERVKIWLACDEHRDYLHDYLAARDFPVVLTPLAEPLDRLPDAAPAAPDQSGRSA
jgi:hypothetical protein